MAFLSLIAGPLTTIVGDVLKRVLPPEKMGEADRAKLEAEVTRELMQQDWQRVEAELRDRVSARELATADVAKGNAFTTAASAMVRPVWGFGAFALVAYPYIARLTGLPPIEMDDNTRYIVQTVIVFYFGGRTAEYLVGGRRLPDNAKGVRR